MKVKILVQGARKEVSMLSDTEIIEMMVPGTLEVMIKEMAERVRKAELEA